ncbi:unnamed protein product [Choristocarpus tenellus]
MLRTVCFPSSPVLTLTFAIISIMFLYSKLVRVVKLLQGMCNPAPSIPHSNGLCCLLLCPLSYPYIAGHCGFNLLVAVYLPKGWLWYC